MELPHPGPACPVLCPPSGYSSPYLKCSSPTSSSFHPHPVLFLTFLPIEHFINRKNVRRFSHPAPCFLRHRSGRKSIPLLHCALLYDAWSFFLPHRSRPARLLRSHHEVVTWLHSCLDSFNSAQTCTNCNVQLSKVTVLGAAGGIGQPLSLLLKMNPRVTDLALYDIRGGPGT